jgi:hypothetical protein
MAREISPFLAEFLDENNFEMIWKRICTNHKTTEKRIKQFHEWFDAFKTMRLIHYLTEATYPTVSMQHAISALTEWILYTNEKEYLNFCSAKIADMPDQIKFLKKLRNLDQSL